MIRSASGVIASAILLLAAASTARAQDPVRLPGVTVRDSASMPGKKILTGIVVDTAGNTIAGVEVTIPALEKRILTAEDGTFRLEGIGKGTYSMRARKIGYAAQIREFHVDTAGGVAEFDLLPLARALSPVVSSASRGGLSGLVGDTAYNAIVGASVKVLSAGMFTTTDAKGEFWLPVKPGHYMVDIQKPGFGERLVGVTVPGDSGRRIQAWLQPFHGHLPVREVHNVEDMGTRRSWILPKDGSFYTREDLEALGIIWIYDAVEMNQSKFWYREPFSRDCQVMVNGGPTVVKLETLTIDDVEAVEVYPGGSSTPRPRVATRAPGTMSLGKRGAAMTSGPGGMSNTNEAATMNFTRVCPIVYVWVR